MPIKTATGVSYADGAPGVPVAAGDYATATNAPSTPLAAWARI